MDEIELTTPRLYAAACRLTNPGDIRNLGQQLGIKDHTIDAALHNHRYCIQEAAYTVLKEWFKGQENNKEAFAALKQALSHPNVNLSKISHEALSPTSVYLTKGKIVTAHNSSCEKVMCSQVSVNLVRG